MRQQVGQRDLLSLVHLLRQKPATADQFTGLPQYGAPKTEAVPLVGEQVPLDAVTLGVEFDSDGPRVKYLRTSGSW